ncbi:hypothetical protein [Nostoc sp.]|uniref:hypothetical protein n=1 Tax=Nostoc sp. TaxID=1180 RepID=UPI002FF6F0EB
MQRNALAMQGDALPMQGDALPMQGDALALQGIAKFNVSRKSPPSLRDATQTMYSNGRYREPGVRG